MNPFEHAEPLPSAAGDEIYINDEYQVNLRHLEKGWTWLSIKRKTKASIHDWRDLQRIKNMLCGDEREALELYPAESRLVDTSNQYHLFVMPIGEKFPFGFQERAISKGHKGGWHEGGGQREFEKGEEPHDAEEWDDMERRALAYFDMKREEENSNPREAQDDRDTMEGNPK